MKETPEHVAIIMDGNRRWVKERKLPVFFGHKKGAETFKNTVRWCGDRGIKYLSVYAFSTENWQRAKREVDFLMGLAVRFFKKNIREFHKNGVRIRVLGSREGLSKSLVQIIEEAEELTKNNDKIIVGIFFNYGGRTEITEAVRKIIKARIPPEAIDDSVISSNLYTADMPDPDLVIRTGGVQRLSNFAPWQSVYAEFYFTKTLWPDFSEDDLDRALDDFASRQRRMGK